MASDRTQVSVTLPRNFTFHYTDGQPPRTPERTTNCEDELKQPSPPRPQPRLRIRRLPRHASNCYQMNNSTSIAFEDVPIPTIETPDPEHDTASSSEQFLPNPVKGFLSPNHGQDGVTSPPKTPLA